MVSFLYRQLHTNIIDFSKWLIFDKISKLFELSKHISCLITDFIYLLMQLVIVRKISIRLKKVDFIFILGLKIVKFDYSRFLLPHFKLLIICWYFRNGRQNKSVKSTLDLSFYIYHRSLPDKYIIIEILSKYDR